MALTNNQMIGIVVAIIGAVMFYKKYHKNWAIFLIVIGLLAVAFKPKETVSSRLKRMRSKLGM